MSHYLTPYANTNASRLHKIRNTPPGTHEFVELFTTKKKLDEYLRNNPEVIMREITMHEVDDVSDRTAK